MGTHYEGSKTEVRALDSFIRLMRCAGTLQAAIGRSLRPAGLTERQFGVLEMLLHLGPLHQHQMGEKLLISRANITLIVDQLSKRRLVRRERDREDRRCITVHLTAEGRRRIDKLFPAHARRIAGYFSSLNANEKSELGRLCKKLGRSLQT